MAKWTLYRQTFGTETYSFKEGDKVTLGRGLNNTVTLSSLVISRAHCVINVNKDELLITDLNSSNGVYVGKKRISTNTPYAIKDSDIVGIGWTNGVPLGTIQDNEKFIFKVVKEETPVPLINRIKFQSDDEFDNIEKKIANLDSSGLDDDVFEKIIKPTLKRKIEFEASPVKVVENNIKKEMENLCDYNQVINILSDSDTELNCKPLDNSTKKPKLETVHEEPQKQNTCKNNNEINIKTENEYLEFEAFNVKQEYFRDDDEAIQIDSDSDSESENWFLRLSQSSPGKPFTKLRDKSTDLKPEDSSYSQMDDDLGCNDFLTNECDDYLDELISIPPQPSDAIIEVQKINGKPNESNAFLKAIDKHKEDSGIVDKYESPINIVEQDEVDGLSTKESIQQPTNSLPEIKPQSKKIAQMIQPMNHLNKRKTNQITPEKKIKGSSKKYEKKTKHTPKKNSVSISNSQKEERKRKLKAIAQKDNLPKEVATSKTEVEGPELITKSTSSKPVTSVKVTASNRQAILIEAVKTSKKKESPKSTTSSKKKTKSISKIQVQATDQLDDIENNEQLSKKYEVNKKSSSKDKRSNSNDTDSKCNSSSNINIDIREPLKSLKPVLVSENSKQVSLATKTKKKVHFSEEKPQIKYFEIEAGNKMKKTSLVKTSLVDSRQMQMFSLEKITLMKILRWNPHWLEEQINNNEPPPILGHNNPPLAIFHSFSSHSQYVQLIGDLLLMEIWECLSIAYMKLRNQSPILKMVITSLPPAPSQERFVDIFNFSVDVSLPPSESKSVPRVGEILLVTFGPETSRYQRFFFVHNVRSLPSKSNNHISVYNVSLHAIFSDKMKLLRPGELMIGQSLAYINKELSLFEAMAYMAGSPLSEAILRPEPRHFTRIENNPAVSMTSQWTRALNESQQAAVSSSVTAALGDKPSIQMVQGPPGTGKSSVICAIVMSYFYDPAGKRQQNRGKILICATSNAAVDELVIRLLNIRQSLPPTERFRMVRVGRAEAMHGRAREVSSQQLAQRDAARAMQDPQLRPGLAEEISHLEAKINMWQTAAQDAAAKGQDPMRVAYCQGRIADLVKRIALLGGGGGGDELRPEQLVHAERRIIEGADIIVTTLASAHNHKMRGLKRRIALCIVDEAGQAIEPETLIPLTLDVTKLTLIGDPQQLPGFICSQRAKQHGLGESLFARLAGSSAHGALLLSAQYRMHAHIAHFPARAFYAGRVRTVERARPHLPVPPYCLLGVASGDRGQDASGANDMEAWGVARLARAVAGVRARGLSLAVVTPYAAHRDRVRRHLRTLLAPSEPQIEVNTVDSFQGQERDVIVVSLARSQGVGFLTDAGRMNVMLTRARHALLICLNPHAVLKHPLWRTLLEDAAERKMYKLLPTAMCQAASQVTDDEILQYVMN